MCIPRACRIAGTVVFVLGLVVIAFWMGGRFVELRDITKECLSLSRFAKLECLLLRYHDEHGVFPPTKYQAAANGPKHSWRILLLPHINDDCRKLYSQYDFSEAWNSPKNLAVGESESVGQVVRIFTKDDNQTADYLAIGDGEDWPSEVPLRARLITKGKDRFLLVEYPDSEIHWMEP